MRGRCPECEVDHVDWSEVSDEFPGSEATVKCGRCGLALDIRWIIPPPLTIAEKVDIACEHQSADRLEIEGGYPDDYLLFEDLGIIAIASVDHDGAPTLNVQPIGAFLDEFEDMRWEDGEGVWAYERHPFFGWNCKEGSTAKTGNGFS